MVVHEIGPVTPPVVPPPGWGLIFRLRVRLAAVRLDARLAAGEDPSSDAALAHRAARLVSERLRSQLARAIEKSYAKRPTRPVLSAAIPVNVAAVNIARPALEQLAAALRSRQAVRAQGVALAQRLLIEPASALYRPAYPEQFYEVAREALVALGADGPATAEQS
jgi:hypothetical protein